MYDVGQLVRIRGRIWQVIEDHAAHAGGDHILRVRGQEQETRGEDFTFIYRPVANNADSGLEDEDLGLEKIELLAAPDLLWQPNTPPSQWERLHVAYRLASMHGSGYLLGLASSRLVIEPYQLAPVIQVMSAPRQRFLLAEDVGMGKTIEAGLIMLELIARGRGDRILIVVPAALQDQWADELQDKFGLTDFEILDSEYLTKDLIPRLPSRANPWYYANRVITSIDFAKQERIMRGLSKANWDLVIVDEAHYLSESGTDSHPIRTDRSKFGEMIAQQCDNLLLLTATPHNGYAQGFYSLLRLLDDARFASASSLKSDTIRSVVIRRSKRQIYKPDGSRKFLDRTVDHIDLSINDPAMAEERRLYEGLSRYLTRRWRRVRNNPNERATVGFALTLLKKRLISSVGAIRISLQNRYDKLTGEKVDPNASQGLLKSYQAGVALSEAQRERVERQMEVCTDERDEKQLAQEKSDLERLLRIARRITPEKDHKARQLKLRLDTFCKEQGRKVIVFTEYKDTLDYLNDYLLNNGYDGRIAVMHGHLDRRERMAQEQLFHQPETLVLLATDAASEGLNFQHDCWTIIHNELPWNPNRLEQRNGRVDRWGQTHAVEVYNMILNDTLEGDILRRLQIKLERIREQLGNASDVLSVTGPLDLDSVLMDGAADYEEDPLETAVDKVDAQVEKALQEGQQALDACRAQFLIAPGAFGPREYELVDQARASTASVLPSSVEIEKFVTTTLPLLGGRAERIGPQLWSLDVPLSLQHSNVNAQYPQTTFEYDTALADHERPPAIEYLALGHPLLNALVARVKSDARAGSGVVTGRMSVRVLTGAQPGFLFTYLGRWQDKRGAIAAEEVIPIFLGLDGSTLLPDEAKVLLDASGIPRNASPDMLARLYEPRWQEAREQALDLITHYCYERADSIATERRPQLEILRQDIDTWQKARLNYEQRRLDNLFKDEVEQLQIPLFEEKAERDRRRALAAAQARMKKELQHQIDLINLRRENREQEIALMEQIVAAPPEAIGALVIVPAEER